MDLPILCTIPMLSPRSSTMYIIKTCRLSSQMRSSRRFMTVHLVAYVKRKKRIVAVSANATVSLNMKRQILIMIRCLSLKRATSRSCIESKSKCSTQGSNSHKMTATPTTSRLSSVTRMGSCTRSLGLEAMLGTYTRRLKLVTKNEFN